MRVCVCSARDNHCVRTGMHECVLVSLLLRLHTCEGCDWITMFVPVCVCVCHGVIADSISFGTRKLTNIQSTRLSPFIQSPCLACAHALSLYHFDQVRARLSY